MGFQSAPYLGEQVNMDNLLDMVMPANGETTEKTKEKSPKIENHEDDDFDDFVEAPAVVQHNSNANEPGKLEDMMPDSLLASPEKEETKLDNKENQENNE